MVVPSNAVVEGDCFLLSTRKTQTLLLVGMREIDTGYRGGTEV
jgi:hypothetical protein